MIILMINLLVTSLHWRIIKGPKVVEKQDLAPGGWPEISFDEALWRLQKKHQLIIAAEEVEKCFPLSNPAFDLKSNPFTPVGIAETIIFQLKYEEQKLDVPVPKDTHIWDRAMAPERIRLHDLYTNLDTNLQQIVNKTFSVSDLFDQAHNKRFSSIGAIIAPVNSEYEDYLREGVRLYQVFENFFKGQAHIEATWQAHLFAPLIRLSCLNDCPSGLLKYKVPENINICRESRINFTQGVFPDICDGWVLARAANITGDGYRQVDNVKIYDLSFDVDVLPQGCMDCGDQVLKMLDFLAELKGSDATGQEMDKSKLLCEMVASSQCFNQVLKINPYIFGFTTSGPQVRFYALKSTGEVKPDRASSVYRQMKEKQAIDIALANQEKGITPALTRSSSSVKSNSSEKSNNSSDPSVLPDKWYYDCFCLENMEITDFTSFVRLLNLLWRIRNFRYRAVRSWLYGAKLGEKKDVALQQMGQNNTNVATKTHTRAANDPKDENEKTTQADKTQQDIAKRLSLMLPGLGDFQILKKDRHSTVMKARTDKDPCVLKSFKKQANFEAEKKIYDWLNEKNFKHKPKLIATSIADGGCLVLEFVDSAAELQIKSSGEIVRFAFNLLQSVEALHACNVVHGDIKRSNLAFDTSTGSVKLFDFAYSEVLTGDVAVDRRGYTEGYLLEHSGQICFRDDLSNVGATLFRMIYEVSPGDIGYDKLLDFMRRSIVEVDPLLHQLVCMLIDTTQASVLQHGVFAHLNKNSGEARGPELRQI